MKTNKIELDFDFIGGQGPLTKIEEKELSDYFKSKKSSVKATIKQPTSRIHPNLAVR